jgi:acyl-CoA thioester hydrolase
MSDDPRFRYYLRVRYGECDAQKVVFNARYGDYVELAVTEFFRAMGYAEELVSGELDYQLVRQTVEWRAPARFDDVVEARVSARRLGNTSFTLAIDFLRAADGTALAQAETVYVLMEHTVLRKRVLPDSLRERLQRGITAAVDHAGWHAEAKR